MEQKTEAAQKSDKEGLQVNKKDYPKSEKGYPAKQLFNQGNSSLQ